mgnify:CR=1 FL=1
MTLLVSPTFVNTNETVRAELTHDAECILMHLALFNPPTRDAYIEEQRIVLRSKAPGGARNTVTFDLEMAPFMLEEEELAEFALFAVSRNRASPADTVIRVDARTDLEHFENFKKQARACKYLTIKSIEDLA